jgi:hypothetical protein
MDSPNMYLNFGLGEHAGVDIVLCSLAFADESRRIAIRAASAPRKKAIKLGGFSANLPPELVGLMYRTIAGTLAGCDITIMGGGTRNVLRSDPHKVIDGIGEVLPVISRASPDAKTIGIVPRQSKLVLKEGVGLIVGDKPLSSFFTVIHPGLDTCLVLQYSADKGYAGYDLEWRLALDYLELLRQEAGHDTLHLIFGGGATTRREILHVVNLPHNPAKPWHVLLISDSGGVAEEFATNAGFCATYRDRLIVCKAADLPRTLKDYDYIG